MKTLLALLAVFHLAQSIEGGGAPAVSPSIKPIHASSPSYTGPGDVVSGATAWYGLRAYNAAHATGSNVSVNIVRASDSHTCDLLITTAGALGNTANCSTGGDNGQSGSSFCTSTTCAVTEMYDQSGSSACGGACNVVQATAADQPSILFSGCISLSPCVAKVLNGAPFLESSSGWGGNHSQQLSQSAVWVDNNYSGIFAMIADTTGGDPEMGAAFSGTSLCGYSGASLCITPTNNVLYAANITYNNTSGHITANTTTNSGSIGTGGLTSGAKILLFTDSFGQGGFVTTTEEMQEAGTWGSGFGSSNETLICKNQQAYWGAGNFGAAC